MACDGVTFHHSNLCNITFKHDFIECPLLYYISKPIQWTGGHAYSSAADVAVVRHGYITPRVYCNAR